MTQEQMRDKIEEETGIRPGKSTISAALSRAGLTHRIRYDDFIPWKRISVDHNSNYIITQLRTGARLKRGLPVKPGDRHRYEKWVENLEEVGAVVHYDITTPEGWFYVPRLPGEEGLVRMPKG